MPQRRPPAPSAATRGASPAARIPASAIPTTSEEQMTVAIDLRASLEQSDVEPGKLPETMAAWVIREER